MDASSARSSWLNGPAIRRSASELLTFTVVGAGPTGVELAGQIAELTTQTLKGAFRHIDSTQARVILLDAAPRGAARDGRQARRQGAGAAAEAWASRYNSGPGSSMSTVTG